MGKFRYAAQFNKGIFSLFNRAAVVGFSFLNLLFMVRIIPKAQIGVWVLYTSVTAIFEMMRSGFIRNPFITHLVSAKEVNKREVITASLTLHFALAFFVSLALALSAVPLSIFWSAPGLDQLFFLYAIQNLILIAFFHFEYLQTAKLQFAGIFVVNAIRQVIPTAFILVHFITGNPTTLLEIAMAQIAGIILGAGAAYFYVRDLLVIDWKLYRKRCAELFHFGKYTFGTNISSMFLRSTDSWMLGRLLSTAAVAVYNPALKLANIFEVPTLAISNFIFPQVAKKMKDQGKAGIRDMYIKSVSLMLALTIPIVLPLYVFSDFFVNTIFGKEYGEAADILEVTVLYSLIIPFNRQFGTLMDALKKPKLNFYTLVMVAVLNVIFNYFFLMWFGIIGCAYGTLLSFLVVFVLNQLILSRHFKINTLRVVEHIFTWYAIGWSAFSAKFIKATT